MFAITAPTLKGMITQPKRPVTNVKIGESTKITGLLLLGITVSFNKSFTPSAIACSKPKNPTTLASEFSAIKGKETDSQDQAAPVVLKAFTVGLAKLQENYGSSLDIKVEGVDVFAKSTNEIVVSYRDPVTGKKDTHTFKYKEDNTKLQSEVDVKINEIIDAYNTSKSGSKPTPGVTGKVDAFGNVIN